MSLTDIYQVEINDINHNQIKLNDFKDQVILFVNVASKCGLTPQYEQLEKLYQDYREKGLIIIGLPCNQFASQEPGSESEIQSFCQRNYGVSFLITEKIKVNGPETHELYKILKKCAPGILNSQAIKWNFTKFLVAKEAKSIHRYAPKLKPLDMEKDIEELLA